jgi:hypothetical protein
MFIKRINYFLPLAVLAFGLALTGCDSGDADDEVPSIGGMYTGSETVEGVAGTFALDVPSTSSGSFTLGDESELSVSSESVTVSFDLTGSGTYDYPDVAMNIEFEIEGEQYSDQMTGTVSASGDILRFEEEGDTFTLTRE